MKKLMVISLLMVLIFGCAKNVRRDDARLQTVKVTTAQQVQNCQPLGEVEAESSFKGFAACKELCTRKAAALGATHIVWQDVGNNRNLWAPTGSKTYVSGLAYKCAE